MDNTETHNIWHMKKHEGKQNNKNTTQHRKLKR